MKIKKAILIIWIIVLVTMYILRPVVFVALLVAVTVVALLIFFGMSRLTGRKIEIIPGLKTQGQKEEPFSYTVEIINRSILPVFYGQISAEMENKLTSERLTTYEDIWLPPKGHKQITIFLKEKYCGQVKLRIKNYVIKDPMGFFHKEYSTEAVMAHDVMACIRTLDISSQDLNKYDMESFKYSAYKKGNDPSETFGIREYTPGDNPKTIHWKLSAKMDEIMVRELGLPIDTNIMIILDNGINVGEIIDAEKKDKLAEFFLSISYTLVKKGIKHVVGWQDYTGGRFIINFINGQSDVWSAMSQLLRCKFEEDDRSAVYHYLESEAEKNYSTYLYVTERGRDIERLQTYGEVNIYRPKDFK